MKASETSLPFTPISPNPYIVGNPVRDSRMFFGREVEFELIYKRFKQGTAEGGLIVLCGERRSGKTSILFQITNGRLGEEFIPVLIDMQSMAVERENEFLGRLATEIAGAFDKRLADDRRPDVQRELDRLQHLLEQVGSGLDAFNHFVQALLQLEPTRRLILLFDEYELFESKIEAGALTKGVLESFAHLIETHRVFMVFTGSLNLEARNRRYWDILGKSIFRKISYLDQRDAVRLITDPVTGRVTYDDGVVDAIVRLTAGQAFYTQAVCQSIVDHLNEERTNIATHRILESVVAGIVSSPFPQMTFLWDSFNDNEKLTLALLAELIDSPEAYGSARDQARVISKRRYPLQLSVNDIETALAGLFDREILLKDNAIPAGYAFKIDLWRLWIRRMHSVWQVMRELKIPFRSRWPVWLRPAILAGAGVALVAVVATMMTQPSKVTDDPPSGAGRRLDYSGTPPHRIGEVFNDLAAEFDSTIIVLPDVEWRPISLSAPYKTMGEAVSIVVEQGGLETCFFGTTRIVGSSDWIEWLVQRNRSDSDGLLVAKSTTPGATITLNADGARQATFDSGVEGRPGFMAVAVVPGGSRRIDVSAPNHRDSSLVVNVPAESVVVRDIRLEARSVSLHVDSTPRGAAVQLNGSVQGRTPLTLTGLTVGQSCSLRLSLETYEARDTVVVPGPEELTTFLMSLRRPIASLMVTTTPEGATILVDNVVQGVSNKEFEVHLLERPRVRLELSGYVSMDTTIRIDRPRTQLSVDMKRKRPAVLVIRGENLARNIFVDDDDQLTAESRTTPDIEITPGNHDIRVVLNNGNVITHTVSVGEGERVTFDYTTRAVTKEDSR